MTVRREIGAQRPGTGCHLSSDWDRRQKEGGSPQPYLEDPRDGPADRWLVVAVDRQL